MTLQVNHKLYRMANAGNSRNIFPISAAAVYEAGSEAKARFKVHRNATGVEFVVQRLPRLRWSGVLALTALLLMAAGLHAQTVFTALQNVGTTSKAQSVTVTAQAAGAVAKVEILTGGASGLDFAKGTGSSTCDTANLAINGTCQESVTFAPAYPGLRAGAIVLLDSSNNFLGSAYLSGIGQGGLDVLVPGNVLDVAGILKQVVSTQNGILATMANLKQPAGVALDDAGNLYISDSAHNQVRMVCFSATSATIAGVTCPGAGIIIAIAGTGDTGYSGNGGPASSSSVTLTGPSGLSLDGAGNLYIADTGNNVIRKIAAATGIITAVAGDGTLGFGGDGKLATASGVELNTPWGVTVDANGNLYIADTGNQRIRVVEAATGIINTVVGNGAVSGLGDGKGTFSGDNGAANAAGLSLPYAVAFDAAGDMFIPDSANNRIREVKATAGAITPTSAINTVVGSANVATSCADGNTSGTALNSPEGVAVDPANDIYIADTGDLCVRKANVTTGQMQQLSETNDPAITAAGTAISGEVFEPIAITLDGLGNVYYADYYFMLINEIQSNVAVLNYVATPVRQGNQSAPQSQIVENDGNAGSNVTSITPDINAAVDAPSTTCAPQPFALTAGEDCTVGAIFAPSTTINPATLPGTVDGNVFVDDDTVNAKLDIVLIGDALAVNSTDITLTSNPNPSEFGKTVTFTATVTTGANTGNLTGQVTFTDTFNGNTVNLGAPVSVNGSGVAVLTSNKLAVGVHTISATYGGDAAHLASATPSTVTQTVYEATKTTLTAVPASPSQVGASVTFTATITVPDGGTYPLDGTVTFTDSLVALPNNTAAIVGGVATYTTAALVQGVNAITATYTPATTTLIQGSAATLKQDVVSTSGVTLTSAPNPSTYGTQVTFAVSIPDAGTTAATGKVNIVILPQGQTTPTYNLTATLAGDPATGTANISTLPVGTYTATATYPGNSNYGASTGTLATPQVVSQVQSTTTLTANPNPAISGQAIAITATVTPSTGTVTPTGTVTFTDTFNGATVTLGTPTLTAKGTATINPANLAAGTHSIVATYAGDTDDAGSASAALSLVINLATTTTTVTAAPSPAVIGATITFTATVATNPAGGSPTGAVTFTAAGGAGNIALGAANLVGGKATVTYSTLPAGTHTITAAYAGDTNDATSSGTTSETVGLIPTTTDLSTATVNGADVLIAIVQNSGVVGPTPTGTVTFYNGTTAIGSATLDANGVASLTPNLPTGSYTVTAKYGGDGSHSPSTSTSITITGQASNFTLTATPSTVTLATTKNTTLKVTLTSISGFTDTIGLGCASLPAGVNCEFSNVSVPLSANGTATTQLTIDTNNPLGGGASALNLQPGNKGISLAGLFLPLSLLLGCVAWRFRRRHGSLLSMVLVLILSSLALLATGCAGFTQNSAAPGTYTIQVVGVGEKSDVTQYQTVTLNITK